MFPQLVFVISPLFTIVIVLFSAKAKIHKASKMTYPASITALFPALALVEYF